MVTPAYSERPWQQPTADERFVVVAAEQGNLAKNLPVAAGTASAATVVYRDTRVGIVFGHVSAATTLSLQVSADGVTWATIAQSTVGAAGDFAFSSLALPGGLQLQLLSSAAVTLTATAVF